MGQPRRAKRSSLGTSSTASDSTETEKQSTKKSAISWKDPPVDYYASLSALSDLGRARSRARLVEVALARPTLSFLFPAGPSRDRHLTRPSQATTTVPILTCVFVDVVCLPFLLVGCSLCEEGEQGEEGEHDERERRGQPGHDHPRRSGTGRKKSGPARGG